MTATKQARPSRGGRPAIGPQVNIAMSPATVARVDTAARAAGVSRSEWIRQAIAERLERLSRTH